MPAAAATGAAIASAAMTLVAKAASLLVGPARRAMRRVDMRSAEVETLLIDPRPATKWAANRMDV
jgi:hypothetical protein